jgi:hypothetical protein
MIKSLFSQFLFLVTTFTLPISSLSAQATAFIKNTNKENYVKNYDKTYAAGCSSTGKH